MPEESAPNNDTSSQSVDTQQETEAVDQDAPLKKAIEAERQNARKAAKEAADLKKRLAALEEIDVEEYKALKSAQEEAKRKKLEEAGEYQKLIAKKDEAITAAEARAQEATAKANKALSKVLLTQAFTANGGDGTVLNHFLKVIGDLEIDEDGAPVIPTALRNDGSEIETLEEWVAHVRDTDPAYGIYFRPLNKAQGSGDQGGKAPKSTTVTTVPASEAYKYIDEIAAGTIKVK